MANFKHCEIESCGSRRRQCVKSKPGKPGFLLPVDIAWVSSIMPTQISNMVIEMSSTYEMYIQIIRNFIKTNDVGSESIVKWMSDNYPSDTEIIENLVPLEKSKFYASKILKQIEYNDGAFYIKWHYNFNPNAEMVSKINMSPNGVTKLAQVKYHSLLGHELSEDSIEAMEYYEGIIKEGSDNYDISYDGHVLKNAPPALEEYYRTLDTTYDGVLYRLSLAGVKVPTHSDVLTDAILHSNEYPQVFTYDALERMNMTTDDVVNVVKSLDLFPVLVCVLESGGDAAKRVDYVMNMFDAIPNNQKCVLFRERRGSSLANYIKDENFSREINDDTKVIVSSISRMTILSIDHARKPMVVLYTRPYNTGCTRLYTEVVPLSFEINLEK